MINTSLYDPNSHQVNQGELELLDNWDPNSEQRIWIDIESKADEKVLGLLKRFGVHDMAIQDATRSRHPPKIEHFDDNTLIIFRGLGWSSMQGDFNLIQISLFIGRNFIISLHETPSQSIRKLRENLIINPKRMAGEPSELAVSIMKNIAQRYVEILLDLETRLDEVEEQVFVEADDSLLAELTRYKTRLRRMIRIATYHKTIAEALRSNKTKWLPGHLEHEITDVYEQIERGLTLANLHYQNCHDLTDGFLGMSSHRLNRIMQLLTIITVIFVPLTFMAGIYGMNFDYIPELKFKWGYFTLLASMAVVAALQVYYFRRKRWV